MTDQRPQTLDHFRQSETFYKDNAALYEHLQRDRNADLMIWLIVMVLAVPICWIVAFSVVMRGFYPLAIRGHFHTGLVHASEMWPDFIVLYTVFGLCALLKANNDHRARAKRKLLPPLARLAGLEYRRAGYFRLADIYDHRLLPPYDGHDVEEGFKGRYHGFDITFQDFSVSMALERFFDFDWRRLRHMGRFRGVAVVIPLNRRLNHHTVLLQKGRVQRFIRLATSERLEEFEAVDFPYSALYDDYAVIATNQVEARYILDPAVLERLMALKQAFGARSVEVSFRKSEMAVVLDYPENAFEVSSLLRPASLLRTEAFLDQVGLLYSIIDIMELSPLAGLGGPGSGVDTN